MGNTDLRVVMVGAGDLVVVEENSCNMDYKEGCFRLCEGMDRYGNKS